jgi:carboxypeptidase Taq
MDCLDQIYARYKNVFHLETVQELLDWDQQVMMPPSGAVQRGEQMGALARQIHRALADPALGELLDEAETSENLSDEARADLRVLRRRHTRAARVPEDLAARHARLTAVAQGAWEAARAERSFAAFRKPLEEVITATREMGLALDPEAPYDALIAEYEPGMDATRIGTLFLELAAEIEALLKEHRAPQTPAPWEEGARVFPAEVQERLAREILEEMGLDFEGLRLDVSTHPCTSGAGRDVRITSRYDERNPLSGLLSAVHEGGHALYEQGLPRDRLATPGGGFCSFGVHESQSLFWENIVGRSRPFLERILPRLRAAFPDAFGGVDGDRFFFSVNRVRPSPVRIEADELTYCLHIVIRFELELALMSGDLRVTDLPEAWDRLYVERLGIRPRDHREGVLQDIHWAAGLFGYFPSYALGYLYAAQFHAALLRERPDLDERIAAGDLGPARDWLERRVHVHAARLLPGDLVREVTGEEFSIRPLTRYWRRKYVSKGMTR